MFKIQPRYLELVQQEGFGCPSATLSSCPRWRGLKLPWRCVTRASLPCNNDLLAENFIDVGGEFRLIDYEYSGMERRVL